jgi:hypothetical protein
MCWLGFLTVLDMLGYVAENVWIFMGGFFDDVFLEASSKRARAYICAIYCLVC